MSNGTLIKVAMAAGFLVVVVLPLALLWESGRDERARLAAISEATRQSVADGAAAYAAGLDESAAPEEYRQDWLRGWRDAKQQSEERARAEVEARESEKRWSEFLEVARSTGGVLLIVLAVFLAAGAMGGDQEEREVATSESRQYSAIAHEWARKSGLRGNRGEPKSSNSPGLLFVAGLVFLVGLGLVSVPSHDPESSDYPSSTYSPQSQQPYSEAELRRVLETPLDQAHTLTERDRQELQRFIGQFDTFDEAERALDDMGY